MEFIAETIAFIVKFPFVVIGWIVVGMIAGDLARRFANQPDRNGFADFLLGIIGAVIGGFIAGLFGIAGPNGGLMAVIYSLIVATLGATLTVMAWSAITTGDNPLTD